MLKLEAGRGESLCHRARRIRSSQCQFLGEEEREKVERRGEVSEWGGETERGKCSVHEMVREPPSVRGQPMG